MATRSHVYRNPGRDAGIGGHVDRNTQARKKSQMTTSLAFSGRGISLVAADTRLSLSDPSFGVMHADGPDDFTLSVSSKNFVCVIPYRMRKIALANGAWFTTAGDFFSGKSALSLLQTHGVIASEEVALILSSKLDEILNISRLLGFSDESSKETRVMAALRQGVTWHCTLSNLKPVVNNGPFSFSINMPPSMDAAGQYLQDQWKGGVENSLRTGDISVLIRATATLIHGAHLYAPCTSSRVQIGFTLEMGEGRARSAYLDGESGIIAAMSDDQIAHSLVDVVS